MKLPAYILSIDNAFGDAEWKRSLGGTPEEVYVNGRYRLEARVGRGSFGAVYRAHDCTLNRDVAVKIMPAGDPDAADREGRALAALDHPNVVSIYDHGVKDDYRWLVLQYLEGPTLADWVEGRSPREILERYLEAGEGLVAAHQRGLVHFDFKPGNVRIAGDGRAVVVDFGMARNLESLREDGESAFWGGTLAYIAPERLKGESAGTRSDQFSFCVALWEALAQENPFGPHELKEQERYAAFFRPPKGTPRGPRKIKNALIRGLSPLPGDRWISMTWLLEALRGERRSSVLTWTFGAVFLLVLIGGLALGRSPSVGITLPDPSLPELDEVSIVALESIKSEDYDGAAQALRVGFGLAVRDGREGDFVRISATVAERFEAADRPHDAVDAWLMTVKLAREHQDAETAEYAKARILALADSI